MRSQRKLSKPRVIFIIFHDLGIGGVQRKIADISRWISTNKKLKNTKIYIILNTKKPYDLEEDIFIDEIKKDKVTIFYKPQKKIWRFKFPLSIYLVWKVAILQPEAILSFMKGYSVLAIIMKYLFSWRGIKVVVSYDNIPSLLIPAQHHSRFKIILWKLIIRLFYPYADWIVLPSDVAKLDMIKNFGVSQDRVIANKNWVLEFPNRKDKKIKYDLIYTGRIDSVKNLSKFVEIVGEIKRKYPKVRACIVGWGKEIDKISKLINEKSLEKQIELAGSQKDVSKYLASSKIFLLTSDFEGLPISALEAMAHGLPVVTTNYPGADELVVQGKTGFVCKRESEFSSKILQLLLNVEKREKMGAQAREYTKIHHSERNLKKFVDLTIS